MADTREPSAKRTKINDDTYHSSPSTEKEEEALEFLSSASPSTLQGKADEDSPRLFVARIPLTCQEQDIKGLMARFGFMVEFNLIKNANSSEHRGMTNKYNIKPKKQIKLTKYLKRSSLVGPSSFSLPLRGRSVHAFFPFYCFSL